MLDFLVFEIGLNMIGMFNRFDEIASDLLESVFILQLAANNGTINH